ncbi:MAG: glycosyltransferase family 39 protein, partial [Candidatus Sumerlaeia bacterium]|nr:glycosyltransferase family 39 protein [Candidatus Sumerlaeia bacterium]
MFSEKKDLRFINAVCFYLIALIIFVLAIWLRLQDIATEPGWFRDEGNYYAVCQTLATTGTPSLGPLNITFCSPFMTHPPFYFYTGSAWLSLFGVSFTSLRIFNVFLSLLTLIILFIFCWRHLGKIVALLSSGFFTLYHDIIVFNRMIFPYNLYMLFALIILFLVVEYLQRPESRFILTASIITAFAGITVYYALWLWFFLLIAIVWQRKLSHMIYLGIVPIPLLLFLSYHLLNNTPGFYEDFLALKKSASPGTLLQILSHYKDFFFINLLTIWGSIGLLFIASKKLRWLIIIFLFIVLSPVLFKADTIIKFVSYPVIPVLPILTIGMSSFLFLFIRAFSNNALIIRLLIYFLLAILAIDNI